MENFKGLEKKLETLLTDTEKVWKNSSSNQLCFSALACDKRTVPLYQEMSNWTKNMKQLDNEVIHKQQARAQNPPVSNAQSPRTNSENHPLRHSGSAKSFPYDSGEDYN